MSESQYYPTDSTGALISGIEVENQDLALIGQTAGLADDRVLAELFRLQPTDGTHVSKAVLHQAYFPNPAISGGAAPGYATVVSTNTATASVYVYPFRAMLGSRIPLGTSTIQNWKDSRSAVFVNASIFTAQPVIFAPNSSGNPRWDLVYCALSIDVKSNTVQRRVKNPSNSSVSVQNVFQYLANAASIQVVQGTPAGTPTRPSVPADSGGVYNFPLAYVRIPNGFAPTNTISPRDIRDASTVVPISRMTGAATVRPANGNNDGAGTYGANFPWNAATTNTRPGMFMPQSWVGSEQLLIEIDATNGTSSLWSHPPGSVVDSSMDWRGRVFVIHCQIDNVYGFANDPAYAGFGTFGVPNYSSPMLTRFGNSFVVDASVIANTSTILVLSNAVDSRIPVGALIGLAVDASSGAMVCAATNAPGVRLWAWAMASAPYPNQ